MDSETIAWAYPLAYSTLLTLLTSSVALFIARGSALLLLVYIVLGSFALKRAPTTAARAACFVAALACVAFMASIAVRHHAMGWWA